MIIDLKNSSQIKKLDPKNVLGSTALFASQCEQIWQEGKKIAFDSSFKNVWNIVISGMGGSAYGGYVIRALFKDSLKVPLISNNDYHLPYFVNNKSLVIVSSYSGSTEESLASFEEAKQRGTKITGITSGGQLKESLDKIGASYLLFDPKFNPSGQPRLGTGYMVVGLMTLLKNLNLISIARGEIENAIIQLKTSENPTQQKAIEYAKKLKGYIPVIFSADFLNGNAHIIRNQFNETSKTFSAFEDLPELNHHLMEGLKNPKDKKLKIIFLASNLYPEEYKKRVKLTQDVVRKNGIDFIEYKAIGKTKLAQTLNVLSFGGYLTLYLALLYKQDPSVIPWVDYFKEQLKRDMKI